MLVAYIFPYLYLALILPSGFGPAGWLLKNGEFNYIFCGCNIQYNLSYLERNLDNLLDSSSFNIIYFRLSIYWNCKN